mgnify:CR=1 FL=1
MICDDCVYYNYDDESQEYFCSANMDEDDVFRFSSYGMKECTFYNPFDEYKVVKKQN